MTTGRVRVFRSDRGFGFITPDDGSIEGDIFVQAANLGPGQRAGLVTGEAVEYQPVIGRDGQRQATAVRPLTGRRNL